jgi:hypothetical protein
MNLARNVTPLLAQLGFFRAKFHSKSLYSVEKKIVGISQYAYFTQTPKAGHLCPALIVSI